MRRALRSLRRRLRIGRLEREEYAGKQPVGNTDAMSATRSSSPDGSIPPHYVGQADEGRPRN
jgi:hypothetical protein